MGVNVTISCEQAQLSETSIIESRLRPWVAYKFFLKGGKIALKTAYIDSCKTDP